MGKGTQVYSLRIPADLMQEVKDTIDRSHETRAGEPWTITAFILTAIREKLNHMERSRRSGRRRPTDNGLAR